ncbi:fructosamine kinase family protein [Almyronema epifaneia]|uniref:Fructosamine kinase family protein n=1 Tax=Almyronema epifaneia S1 TaxID=2991925 RepID=A0ABW6II41_9CYAN
MWNTIAQHISQTTGQPFEIRDRRSVGGGSINQAYAITDGEQTFFLKLNQATQLAMFEREALGLKEIAASHTLRVPRPVCWGLAESSAYVVMEWLDLGAGNAQAWQKMGQQLAAMHQVESSQGFGWSQDNTIGSTPQLNPWTSDWLTFYREHRLRYQLQLASRRGHFPRSATLLAALPDLLAGHEPKPVLVHGDLWSGNAAVTTTGEPVVLDPAVYYGDREVDVAMTELFGGFPASFYQGYNDAYALDPGYARRKVLYNLYHILNHFNLFGGGYGAQANRMIDQILSS